MGWLFKLEPLEETREAARPDAELTAHKQPDALRLLFRIEPLEELPEEKPAQGTSLLGLLFSADRLDEPEATAPERGSDLQKTLRRQLEEAQAEVERLKVRLEAPPLPPKPEAPHRETPLWRALFWIEPLPRDEEAPKKKAPSILSWIFSPEKLPPGGE